jgi:hypothetical protein
MLSTLHNSQNNEGRHRSQRKQFSEVAKTGKDGGLCLARLGEQHDCEIDCRGDANESDNDHEEERPL